MSANDYIVIRKKGDKYTISHKDSDSDGIYSEEQADSPLEALRKAGEIQSEYGITFIEDQV